MAAEDLNLSGVRDLRGALGRLRNGTGALELATRMGLWTEALHDASSRRASFPREMSSLTPAQLSDLYSAWTAEFGRVLEVCGALEGQSALVKLQVRSAEAAARARIRRADTSGKSLTQQALSDLSAEVPEVRDLYEQQAMVALLMAHAEAAKEATAQYLATISREIAFRDAQMKARLY